MYTSPDCPYFLLSALPFAFVTATNHFVSSAALQGMAHLPPLRMEKHYYKLHIEDIKKRLGEAKALGGASVEEWTKGLPSEGKERRDDAIRWEQWEARGGLKKVNAKAPAKQSSTPAISSFGSLPQPKKGEDHSSLPLPQNLQLPAKPPVDLGSSASVHATDTGLKTSAAMCKFAGSADTVAKLTSIIAQFHPGWAPSVSYADNFAQRPPGVLPQARPERNIRDVNEAKAIRKAEIERRCQQLQPPLPLNILNHMESFQAAIQISQPLTESAWDVLKPRLLAQRPYAERKEKERIQQDELLQEEYKQRRQQEVQLKETKEALDREWDTVQAPVRNRISALADKLISEKWSNGDDVSKENSPKFAADVLMYVRERFYADIAHEDDQARAKGQPVRMDQPNEPPTRKLILENMKWLFDTKIKPLTENFQRELFLCNGCEGNFKFYGFEGVVQHYAAKHTNNLSMGSVVVHWRAEWPEHPPFHPHPSAAKTAYYKVPTPVNASVPGPSPVETKSQSQSYPGYGQGPSTSIASVTAQQVYHSTQMPAEAFQAPFHSAPQTAPFVYPTEHRYHPHPATSTSSLPTPPSNAGPIIGYQAPQQAVYSNVGQTYTGYSQPQFGQVGPAYGPHVTGPQYHAYGQGQNYVTAGTHLPDSNGHYFGQNTMGQPSTNYVPRPMTLHPSGLSPEIYQTQLDELAKHAREVWFGTSGIKDIPQSVRIFVVIHHAASRFATSFSTEPTLAMFIDGLDNHSKMRPVRSLNGLACKTCVNAASSNGQQTFSQLPVADRRLYTLPHLLNHFRTTHLEPQVALATHANVHPISNPDWKRDMIELPELTLIADLIHAQGIDDTKLSLIASVFPEAFPNPLPQIGRKPTNIGPVPVLRAGGNQSASTHQFSAAAQTPQSNTPENTQPFARPISVLRASSPRAQSSEPAGEDEYDPHRPAYLGKIIKPDLDAHFTPSRDYGIPSPKQNIPTPTDQYVSSEPQYLATDHPSSGNSVQAGPPSVASGRHDRYYDSKHTLESSGSQEYSPELRAIGRYSEVHPSPSEQYAYHDSNERAYNENMEIVYRRSKENGLLPEEHGFKQSITSQTNSPAEAADQFLRSFQISKSQDSPVTGSYEHDDRLQTTSTWEDKAYGVGQDRSHNGSAGPPKWDASQNDARQTSDSHSITNSIRAASLISKAAKDSSQGLKVQAHQEDEYRPPSHIQIPLSANGAGRSSPPYNRYTGSRHGFVSQQYAVNDAERSRETRVVSYHQSPDSHYRSRSRSPRSSHIERGFYRSRSPPKDESRQEPLYHIVSPPVRKEPHSQRLVGYEYPVRERYEYVNQGISSEDRYGRRVELLPVIYEQPRPAETGRYVLASQYGEPAPPGYVRVDQGYRNDHFYEHDGQLYRAGPVPQSFAPEYRF